MLPHPDVAVWSIIQRHGKMIFSIFKIFSKIRKMIIDVHFYRKRRRPTHCAPFRPYQSKDRHHQLLSRIKRTKWCWWRIVQVESSSKIQKSKLKTKSTGQYWSIDVHQSYRGEVSKNQKSADNVEFAEFRRADSGISISENN